MRKSILLTVSLKLSGDFPPEYDVSKYAKNEIRERLHADSAVSRNDTRVRVISIEEIQDNSENVGVTLPPGE